MANINHKQYYSLTYEVYIVGLLCHIVFVASLSHILLQGGEAKTMKL